MQAHVRRHRPDRYEFLNVNGDGNGELNPHTDRR